MSAYTTSLIDCYFTSPDSGFVVGGLGAEFATRKAVILFTSNGGTSWVQRVISSIEETWGWKISFPSKQVGYVSIEKLTTNGSQSFFKTTDGGESWQQKPFSSHQEGIGFADELHGWLGAVTVVKETTDGGETWKDFSFGVQYPYFNRTRFFGDSIGYAVGSVVFKYTADSIIGIPNLSENLPENQKLHQNYPNPFNPSTIIKFEIFVNSMTYLSIYNSIGEEVFDIVYGYRAPGVYELNWDGRDNYGKVLPSGIYFYKLQTEKYTETKKMILVR